MHTPGPWTTDSILSKEPLDICLAYEVPGEGHPIALANVLYDEDDSPREAHANALLMAASPDLLDACKSAIQALGMHGPCRNNSCKDCTRTWNKLHEAIAKAEGKTRSS